MNDKIYTDLALESRYAMEGDLLSKNEYSEKEINGVRVCKLEISTEELSKKYGRGIGHYITLDCEHIWLYSESELEKVAQVISAELSELMRSLSGGSIDSSFSVLVAGLGNADMTPDAIGPLTTSRLTVTRHLRSLDGKLFRSLGQCEVSAISPGVLAQTGIETVELIKGAIRAISPNLLIAVDALAARSCRRLGSTVQISDCGISPGSGIGNLQKAINKENLGIPVIAIGVPTVVDSSTLVYDALEKAGMDSPPDTLREVLENGRGFFVSPKESDMLSERGSILLSRALDMSFGQAE